MNRQAVSVTLGGNDSSLVIGAQNVSSVDMYPGGEYSSLAFEAASCTQFTNGFCGAGGFWTPDENDVASGQYITLSTGWNETSWGVYVQDAPYNHLGLTVGGHTVYN